MFDDLAMEDQTRHTLLEAIRGYIEEFGALLQKNILTSKEELEMLQLIEDLRQGETQLLATLGKSKEESRKLSRELLQNKLDKPEVSDKKITRGLEEFKEFLQQDPEVIAQKVIESNIANLQEEKPKPITRGRRELEEFLHRNPDLVDYQFSGDSEVLKDESFPT